MVMMSQPPVPPVLQALFAKAPHLQEQIMSNPQMLQWLIQNPDGLAELAAKNQIDLSTEVPSMMGEAAIPENANITDQQGRMLSLPNQPPPSAGVPPPPPPMQSPDDMMAMGQGAAGAVPGQGQAGGIDLGAMIQQGMQYLQQLGQAPAQGGMQSPDDMMAMGPGAAMSMPGAAQAGPAMNPGIPMGAMQGMPAGPPQAGPPAGPGAGPPAGGGIPPAVVAAAQAMGAGGGAGAAPQIPPATGAAPGGGEVDQLGQILQAVGSAYEAPPQPGTPAPPRPGSVPGNPGFLQMLGSTMGNHPIPSLGALIGLGLMMK